MRSENVEILKLLEQLHTSVKIVSNSNSNSPSPSISSSKQKTPLPSQKPLVYSPKPIQRSNQSFKAKSYFSLNDDSKPQHPQQQNTTSPVVNVSNNVQSMAAAKIINLKRNSVNFAHQGQLSIDALRTKTKEFITGIYTILLYPFLNN